MGEEIRITGTTTPQPVAVLTTERPFPIMPVLLLILIIGLIGMGIFILKNQVMQKSLKKKLKTKLSEIQADKPVTGKVTYTYKNPSEPYVDDM